MGRTLFLGFLESKSFISFLYALTCLPFQSLIPKGEEFVDQSKPKYIKYQDHHFKILRPFNWFVILLSHPDLRGQPGCVSYVRQRRTTHTMTKCIEINVTNIITLQKCLTKINDNNKAN
jgi:hypothetical protein